MKLELEPGAGSAVTRLSLVHDEFPEDSAVYRACTGGWPQILSSLKTLLEIGHQLHSSVDGLRLMGGPDG